MNEMTAADIARALDLARCEAPNSLVARALLALADENERLRSRLGEVEAERDEAVNWNDIVDRHGTDQFDDLAERWLAMEPITRVHNAVASVFSKWANDDLMARFKQHMSNSLQMAFVEGCLVGVRVAESHLATLRERVAELEGALKAADFALVGAVNDSSLTSGERAFYWQTINTVREAIAHTTDGARRLLDVVEAAKKVRETQTRDWSAGSDSRRAEAINKLIVALSRNPGNLEDPNAR